MSNCPCCANQLLRHIREGQIQWFCRHCWLDMPVLTTLTTGQYKQGQHKQGQRNFHLPYPTHQLLLQETNQNQLVS